MWGTIRQAPTSVYEYSSLEGDHLSVGTMGVFVEDALRDACFSFGTDVNVTSTPVTASYHGCMTVKLRSKALDLDEALYKHSDITSHSCPPVEAGP